MPKVAIYARRDGMIFDRIANLLETEFKARAVQVVRQDFPQRRLDAAASLYLPYYFMTERGHWDVPVFTHLEETQDMAEKRFNFQRVAHFADVCVAMSNRTAKLLPPWKTEVIEIPATPDFHTKDVIRIFCPTYQHPNNRKNLEVLEALNVKGVELIYTGGAVPQEEMPSWYNKIDYVLVTGKNEGGPMAVKEAIAMGKPVIAPDAGWCWEYPVIRYTDTKDLERVIRQLAPQPSAWSNYTEALLGVLARSPKWQASTSNTD